MDGIEAYLDQILTMADEQLMGWALWSYDPGDWSVVGADGEDNPRAEQIVRPYPRAVNGIPTALSWDGDAKVLRFSWNPNPDAQGPTLVSIPAGRHYPDGFVVLVDGEELEPGSAWDAEREVLSLEPDGRSHDLCLAPATDAC